MNAYDSDLELARRMASGDEAAWARCLRDHGAYVSGVLRGMLLKRALPCDNDRVEELLSAVVTALAADGYRVLRGYEGRCSLRSWLFVVARTVLRREIRQNSQLQCKDSGFWNSYVQAAGDGSADARAELLSALKHAREQLTVAEDRLLTLFYEQSRSQSEIARELGLTETNVAVRLHRLREKIRALVAAGGGRS
jgi:RNA polymerase sigma factor (sigma-70 family)